MSVRCNKSAGCMRSCSHAVPHTKVLMCGLGKCVFPNLLNGEAECLPVDTEEKKDEG